MKKVLQEEAGFTLLELIVVVAVIGILAAIVVPQIGGIQDNANVNSTKASLSSIQTALEEYKLTEGDGEYPNNLSDLNVNTADYSYATDSIDSGTDAYAVTKKVDGITYYINGKKSNIATASSTTSGSALVTK